MNFCTICYKFSYKLRVKYTWYDNNYKNDNGVKVWGYTEQM
jgi:hypothetical protein